MATVVETGGLGATRLPGPPELLPGRPDAIVDLQTDAGAALVGGTWRYADARVEEIGFVEVGAPDDPLGPGEMPNRTFDVVPHAEAADFDDSGWRTLAPAETMLRLGNGRVSFNWYRIEVTIPERVGGLATAGATAVFEVVVDDYAEVWVNGDLPLALGTAGGPVVAGFNVPNRVVLSDDVRPGERFQIAVFGINGPISASPPNYIWLRSATIDFYAAGRPRTREETPLEVEPADSRLAELVPDAVLERVAAGFESTAGPVWTPDGALLFSSPRANVIYRWTPAGRVDVFRPKSGYAGVDVGRHEQPGSNGLAFSPERLLTICQHGNRRVLRVNPHGDTAVVADSFEGRRLNSPHDLVYRSDGTLYFTDPPFGFPEERELPFGGVFRVRGGAVELLTGELEEPTGLALSPDERRLYVVDGRVVRYDADTGDGRVFFDMEGEDLSGGIEVDRDGNLYVCGPGGIQVVSTDGDHLGTLRLPEPPQDIAWGDDGATLYVTAATSVYRLRPTMPTIPPE